MRYLWGDVLRLWKCFVFLKVFFIGFIVFGGFGFDFSIIMVGEKIFKIRV